MKVRSMITVVGLLILLTVGLGNHSRAQGPESYQMRQHESAGERVIRKVHRVAAYARVHTEAEVIAFIERISGGDLNWVDPESKQAKAMVARYQRLREEREQGGLKQVAYTPLQDCQGTYADITTCCGGCILSQQHYDCSGPGFFFSFCVVTISCYTEHFDVFPPSSCS